MQEEYKGYTITIEPDEDAESPREWDNLGVLACYHRRYELGDKGKGLEILKGQGCGQTLESAYRRGATKLGAVVILPLYLYDHSGLRIKVGDFQGLLPQGHAEFDTMLVGVAYVTREAALKEYGNKRVTKKVREQAEKVLRAEVDEYDKYLRGDYYRYSTEDADGNVVDSLCGIDDEDYALKQAKSEIDAIVGEQG